MENNFITIIMGTLSVIFFLLAYFIGIKEKLSIVLKNKTVIDRMDRRDKREAGKELSAPFGLMGILLIAFVLSNGKLGISAYFVLLVSIALFIYIENKIINNIRLQLSKKRVRNNNGLILNYKNDRRNKR